MGDITKGVETTYFFLCFNFSKRKIINQTFILNIGMKKKKYEEGREGKRKERKERKGERERERENERKREKREREKEKKERTKLLWIFKKSIVQTQPSLETLLQTSGPHKNHSFVKKGREEKKEEILFLALQNRLASVTKTGSRLLVVTESNFMLQFSSFLNVFL